MSPAALCSAGREWLSDGSQSVLRLYLKETGGFYGYSVVWEEDGSLRFSFKHAPGSQSLAGKRIVIDPGHGGSHVGTAAGNVTEKSMTLKYALAPAGQVGEPGGHGDH